ncbi:MAG: T9SS type A sorting domain-containing protein [Flavobacteriales bacterium]
MTQFTRLSGVGIQEELATQVSIHLNPAEQFIQIRNETMVPFENIVITDAVGKLVHLEGQTGIQADHRINVETLEAGSYILSIQTSDGLIVKRFTVL